MDGGLKGVEELHLWNKRVLSFGGMWPLEKTYVKFYAGFVYFIIHLVMSFGDLFIVLGDLSLTIENLAETAVHVMIAIKLLVLRHSTLLQEILQQVLSGAEEDRYKDEEEKKLYLSYNTVGRIFFITGSRLAMITLLFGYFKPFEEISKAVFYNETISFILPYRMWLFFNITDTRTYFLVYLSQCPMIYFLYMHTISICFFCTLVVHVAGDLSIHAHRIRNINRPDSSNDYCDPAIAFRNIVIEHHQIIRIATAINHVFNIILLEEIAISTILIGLTLYSTISISLATSLAEFIFFLSYCTALVVLILVYCIAGDFFIRESINVHDAYYECRWYAMRPKYRKHMIICMSRAQKPLQLTAGRFYIFSLPRFSEILKTAMAYVSMLRTVG